MKKLVATLLCIVLFIGFIKLCNDYKINALIEKYIQFSYNKNDRYQGKLLIDYANSITWSLNKTQNYEVQLIISKVYFLINEIEQSLSTLKPINQTSEIEVNVYKGIINELIGNKEEGLVLYQKALSICDSEISHCWVIEFLISNDLEKFKQDSKLEDEFLYEVLNNMFSSGNFEKDRKAYIYHIFIENS